MFETHPRAGIVSPLICYAPEKSRRCSEALFDTICGDDVHTPDYRAQPDYWQRGNRPRTIFQWQTADAHGAAMMAPRQILAEAGPMNEDFFLYYEELDWSERIRRRGGRFGCNLPRVLHKESFTVKNPGRIKNLLPDPQQGLVFAVISAPCNAPVFISFYAS